MASLYQCFTWMGLFPGTRYLVSPTFPKSALLSPFPALKSPAPVLDQAHGKNKSTSYN